MLKRRAKKEQVETSNEAGALAPEMRELILSFDGGERRKRWRIRPRTGRRKSDHPA